MKSYRELEVWQRAIELVEGTYQLTALLPQAEKFGLVSQLQRAAVSIPANIAEGYGRSHRGDYLHHLSFARGSLFEFETLLTVVGRLKLASRSTVLPVWRVAQDVGKMLTRLIASLQSKAPIRNPKP